VNSAQCDDGIACTLDVCDPIGGCTSTPQDCPSITACSADGVICKEIGIADADGDGLVEAGEFVDFGVTIRVSNTTSSDWKKAQVRDRFGTELDVSVVVGPDPNPTSGTAGISSDSAGRESVNWRLGVIAIGGGAALELSALTAVAGGVQQFAGCGLHKINVGASITYTTVGGVTASANTGIVTIPVVTEDGLGDCDEDGVSDSTELDNGTNPFDALDFP
jgi:hypothetical protein